jgi:hypothetical protein
MKYIITESKLESVIFNFLDDYLNDFQPSVINDVLLFGRGLENQIAYDKGEKLLMVRESLFNMVKNMFSLSTISTRDLFKAYFLSKGYKVKRMV